MPFRACVGLVQLAASGSGLERSSPLLSAACLCCGARKHLLFRLPGRQGIGYPHGDLPVPAFHLVCLCLFISFVSCACLPKCCFMQDKFNTSRDAVCVQKSIYKASSRSFHQKTEFSKRYSRMDVLTLPDHAYSRAWFKYVNSIT